jgi:hypothetical protein
LRLEGGHLRFDFAGPAVVVEDGTAYLSVEHALAKAALHEAMELHAEFKPWPAAGASAEPRTETLVELITRPEHGDGIFGRVTGHCSIAGAKHRLEAVGRLGRSFVGIGNGAFTARRMIWAAFPDGASPQAIEARTLTDDEGASSPGARVLDRGRWTDANLERLKLTPATPRRPPRRISALLSSPDDDHALAIDGEVLSFVMLSRPGPAQSRILTSLGFASFLIGNDRADLRGAGMFECSHRSASSPRAPLEDAENKADDDNGES